MGTERARAIPPPTARRREGGADEAPLRLDPDRRGDGLLTGLELADGRASGGLLVPSGDGLVFLLFTDDAVAVGDEVALPSGRRFTVTSVRDARLGERPVTALGIRPRAGLDPVPGGRG